MSCLEGKEIVTKNNETFVPHRLVPRRKITHNLYSHVSFMGNTEVKISIIYKNQISFQAPVNLLSRIDLRVE